MFCYTVIFGIPVPKLVLVPTFSENSRREPYFSSLATVARCGRTPSCGRRDYHFGLAMPTIPWVTIFVKNRPCDVIRNDEENESNNVSIVSILPGEAVTFTPITHPLQPEQLQATKAQANMKERMRTPDKSRGVTVAGVSVMKALMCEINPLYHTVYRNLPFLLAYKYGSFQTISIYTIFFSGTPNINITTLA